MPLGKIALLAGAAGILRVVIEFFGEMIAEIVLEILVRGPGYFICRFFKKDIDPDSLWVLLAGVVFWILVGVVGYFVYRHISTGLAIDRCLDAGGRFDDQANTCVYGTAAD